MYSRDAVYYDLLNQDLQTNDLPFYAAVVPRSATRICEAACGTGRILLSLAAPGRSLTGMDLSADMLAIARRKSEERGIMVRWAQADMRHLPSMGPADIIICGYNSLQHLCGEEDVALFLQGARSNLAPDGMLILDVFNPDPRFLFPQGNRRALAAFTSDDGAAVEVEEETLYHPDTLINDITYHYRIHGCPAFSEEYRMRQYAPDVLDRLIGDAGLRIECKFGDYDRSPFTPASPKQIYLLRR